MTEVYDSDVQVTVRGVPDEVGLPHTSAPVEVVGAEVLAEIREGGPGGQGPQGDPAWPWMWMGDAANLAALQAMGLGYADARKAWRSVADNAVYYWTGREFIRLQDAFGKTGPTGPPAGLTGAAVSGTTGSSASAAITGTAPNQTLTVTFPRGATGDTGPAGSAGALADAADVTGMADARDGSILSWDTVTSRWVPVPAPRLGGPWSIAGAQFSGASNISAASQVLATMTIPAQPIAWRPIVIAGQLNIRTNTVSVEDTRIVVEVRLGGADGDLIGFGFPVGADNNHNILLSPRWEQVLTPDSTHATVSPNQSAMVVVLAKRISGTRTYSVVNAGCQLVVMSQALKVQP